MDIHVHLNCSSLFQKKKIVFETISLAIVCLASTSKRNIFVLLSKKERKLMKNYLTKLACRIPPLTRMSQISFLQLFSLSKGIAILSRTRDDEVAVERWQNRTKWSIHCPIKLLFLLKNPSFIRTHQKKRGKRKQKNAVTFSPTQCIRIQKGEKEKKSNSDANARVAALKFFSAPSATAKLEEFGGGGS